jgi:hypothetical protein
MTRRIVLLLVGISIALLGCGPPWQVVRQATPNPLVGVKTFALKPIDFTGLRVGEKTEQGYLAEKDEESRSNWVGDKKGMNEEFTKTLLEGSNDAGIAVKPGGEADFTVEPKVPWLEPGFYAAVVNKASEVQLTLIIRDKDGKVVDEVTMKHSTAANLTNPAVGNRLRDDAEALGEYAAEYLKSRVSPEA